MEKSEKTALIAISINFFLFVIKAIAAAATGSIALKAEVFHTLADFVASSTVFLGLKIAKRKTKAFPYGLYKIENLMSVIISILILYTGYEIAVEALHYSTEIEIKNSAVGIVILVFAVIITFLFSKYEKKIAKELESPILLADSEHIRTDVLSNSVVMIAIVGNSLGYQLDKYAALIVVVFIVKAGIEILKDGVSVLLDASVDYETLSKTEKIIENTPQVVEIKTLTGRNSGRFKFIEANIVIKTHNLDKAHLIADKIENQIKHELCNINQVLIHYEPVQKNELIYAVPLTEDKTSINSHFGEAPWFLIAAFNEGNKTADRVDIVENPYINEEKGKGILAAEFLIKNGIDIIIIKKAFVSKGPEYVFSDANVEVLLTEEDTPKEAMNKFGLNV
ncbi:cation diffusion facilitator family transporter [Anaerovorax odorimutans]|uniref:cation diffusion facilitator family transporter n=1 Tax=Anaerovorax odorimutans TaxID=109327 RepID=UPI00041DC6F4|nr:cation diffusion facilitator family transporter [Anaerovorax odorimutans]